MIRIAGETTVLGLSLLAVACSSEPTKSDSPAELTVGSVPGPGSTPAAEASAPSSQSSVPADASTPAAPNSPAPSNTSPQGVPDSPDLSAPESRGTNSDTPVGAGGAPSTGGLGEAAGDAGAGGVPAEGPGGASGGGDAGGGGFGAGGGAAEVGAGGGGGAAEVGAGGGGGAADAGGVFHIFMLMGQSNMAGVPRAEDSDRNTDERLLVLGGCNQPAGQWNLANPPLNECPGESGLNLSFSVGPGMHFAKTLLPVLPAGDTIGLVGTAESGESINTFISGGSHHQMILDKIAIAKTAENGRFAGIIFHQGESDNMNPDWPGKVVQLYDEVKAAFGADYEVPFILGELPQGGCCVGHNTRVHEAAEQLPMGYWVSQEGTNVMDAYHFDHPSVILMGQRYGETMLEALGW